MSKTIINVAWLNIRAIECLGTLGNFRPTAAQITYMVDLLLLVGLNNEKNDLG